mmetsp:Transcript_37749/g.82245  ORF Transcript_37749/g.82245 Transcript_37749/m.82245 type:complete len:293 (+) Transcript_37749:276-1154(+)
MEPGQNKQMVDDPYAPHHLLRVGTFNVHGFSNGHCQDTFPEICEMICDANLDILALQEATGKRLPYLLSRLGSDTYTLAAKHGGTAILTRLPVVKRNEKPGKGRYSWCTVSLPGDCEESHCQTLSIIAVHLDHKSEKKRKSEIKQIVHSFHTKGVPLCDLWLGDFNALTESDYSHQEWRDITQVRSRNHWELPVTYLTSNMVASHKEKDAVWQGLGLTDAFQAAPRDCRKGPLSTCRFGTRIDYVYFQSEKFNGHGWQIVAIEHRDSKKCSDHNLVVATFENSWRNDQSRAT